MDKDDRYKFYGADGNEMKLLADDVIDFWKGHAESATKRIMELHEILKQYRKKIKHYEELLTQNEINYKGGFNDTTEKQNDEF
jgi:hypothetical protein